MQYKTQRELAWSLGYPSTKHIRGLVNSLRKKGWWVCANRHGMYRTESSSLRDQMAASLIARAHDILAAAEGLMRKDREELTLEEQMLWVSLPDNTPTEEEIKTSFDYITEDEVRRML